jgi:hypothetical protein
MLSSIPPALCLSKQPRLLVSVGLVYCTTPFCQKLDHVKVLLLDSAKGHGTILGPAYVQPYAFAHSSTAYLAQFAL